jgi:hypothetical protein
MMNQASSPLGITQKTRVVLRYYPHQHSPAQLQYSLAALPTVKELLVLCSANHPLDSSSAVLASYAQPKVIQTLLLPNALVATPLSHLWEQLKQQQSLPSSNTPWTLLLEAGQVVSPSSWFQLDVAFQSPPAERLSACLQWQLEGEATLPTLSKALQLPEATWPCWQRTQTPAAKASAAKATSSAQIVEGINTWHLPVPLHEQEQWLNYAYTQTITQTPPQAPSQPLAKPQSSLFGQALQPWKKLFNTTVALSEQEQRLLNYWAYLHQTSLT